MILYPSRVSDVPLEEAKSTSMTLPPAAKYTHAWDLLMEGWSNLKSLELWLPKKNLLFFSMNSLSMGLSYFMTMMETAALNF